MIKSHTLKRQTSRADTIFEKASSMRSHLKTLHRTMDMRKGRICLTLKNNEHLSRILNTNINFLIKIYCSTLNGETDLSFHVQWSGLTSKIIYWDAISVLLSQRQILGTENLPQDSAPVCINIDISPEMAAQSVQ